jgi:hypothetical protein
MSSRNKREMLANSVNPLFGDEDNAGAVSPSTNVREIDAGIFGGSGYTLDLPEVEHLNASGMSISTIFPHPAQPRRVLPTRIRQLWNGKNDTLGDVFDAWVEEIDKARAEKGNPNPFDVQAYLNQESQDTDLESEYGHDSDPGPMEASLLHLLELAVSIKNQGLMNPITVAAQGKQYMVETGERRWFAYHLLYHYTGDKKYTTIPARNVPQVDVWRQATENTARQNLNAIGRARQLAILIMDLLRSEKKQTFTPMSEFMQSHEQNYYAQVSDGMDMRIPRNSADKLLAATGFKTKEQLRNHRALLRLPVRVWELADDLAWTEHFIRDLMRESGNDEVRMIQLAELQAEKDGYNVSAGTLSTQPGKTKKSKASKASTPSNPAYYAEFVKMLGKAGAGKDSETRAALERLTELRLFLDEQEHQLRRFLNNKK